VSGHVLVAGASGLVGTSVVDSFLADGWDVIAVSRRRPEIQSSRSFQWIPADLRDPAALDRHASHIARVSHIVFAALYEMPGLVSGWTSVDHGQINLDMLRNVIEPTTSVAEVTHVSLMQGSKAYGVHLHDVPIPARERMPRDDHPNFYWLQEDYLRSEAERLGFGWTIYRPAGIFGATAGVAMNNLIPIGVYAAICKTTGRPFAYPGGAAAIRQGCDVSLLARAILWGATNRSANGEHFNVTNGEVFSWPDLWPTLAESFGVQDPGHAVPTSLAKFLPAHEDVWRQIVAAHHLRPMSLGELLGESHHLADFAMNYGQDQTSRPAVVSSVKIKRFGFNEVVETDASARHWIKLMQQRRLLPFP